MCLSEADSIVMLHLAGLSSLVKRLRQVVRQDRAAHAAADDQYLFHVTSQSVIVT